MNLLSSLLRVCLFLIQSLLNADRPFCFGFLGKGYYFTINDMVPFSVRKFPKRFAAASWAWNPKTQFIWTLAERNKKALGPGTNMAVGQNYVPVVNIKMGGTWVFIRPKMEG